jgi:glycosyltransferase involved in cell wall biosynthesis
MISLLIPLYNWDITPLVRQLHAQLVSARISFEIVIMDDASDSCYIDCLQEVITLPCVRLITLTENIGRAKIRNALAKEAIYPYLIFMDCDSFPASNDYIAQYLPYCKPNTVVCGGHKYDKGKTSDATILHWKYGIKREALPASERQKHPNYSFSTNNFLIDKNIFNTITFNKELKGYGHEDTFFGLELLGHHIPVLHIDNPLIHSGLETASVFLKKTENGILNLHQVEQFLKEKYPDYVGHSKLVRARMLLQKWHLLSFTGSLLKMLKPLLKRNLSGKHPSLFIFDLYKLESFLKIR